MISFNKLQTGKTSLGRIKTFRQFLKVFKSIIAILGSPLDFITFYIPK